jgi:hypothetical protein
VSSGHSIERILCNERDIRNVVRINDTGAARSYALPMTDRIGKEHTMKRIATLGVVVTAFAVAPASALAGGGNFAAQVKPQVSAQVVRAQVANAQRAQAAISAQRHQQQIALARRIALLRPLIR